MHNLLDQSLFMPSTGDERWKEGEVDGKVLETCKKDITTPGESYFSGIYMCEC